MKKILVVNGANLNFLGKFDVQLYGSVTLDELIDNLKKHAERKQYELTCYQNNCEGNVINKIYECYEKGFDGLVMNPAGFTYAGYALRDCIRGIDLPYVNVHLSNIDARDVECVLSPVSIGSVVGFGVFGYELALDALLNYLDNRE